MDTIKFFLDITGDKLDTEEMKLLLNTGNIVIHNIGDKFRSGKLWTTNYLSLRFERETLINFSNQLYAFLNKFEHNIEKINKYVQEHNLEIELTAEILKEDKSNPVITIEAEVLKKLSDLNCLLDIDLMGGS